MTTIAELVGKVIYDLKRVNTNFLDAVDLGATRNGTTDDSKALTAATGRVLHLRPGTYYIAQNLTIGSPTIFAQGAVLKIAPGVTVTFTNRVFASVTQIFSLPGGAYPRPASVIFSAKQGEAHCEWFGAGQGVSDDLAACNDAYAACVTNKVPLHLNTSLSACPSESWTMSTPIPIVCNPLVYITSTGAVNCFTFTGGWAVATLHAPNISGFSGAAFYLDATAGNVFGNTIWCPLVTNCGYAVRQIGLNENNTCTFNIHNVATVTTVWSLEGEGLIEGNEFVSNFWNGFHFGVDFDSLHATHPLLTDGNRVKLTNIDVNYVGAGAIIRSNTRTLVRFVFDNRELTSYFGGLDPTFKVAEGSFASCEFRFGPVDPTFWDNTHWDTFGSGGNSNTIFSTGFDAFTVFINAAASPYNIPYHLSCFPNLIIEADDTAGAITVNLPSPVNSTGRIQVTKASTAVRGVTVSANPYTITKPGGAAVSWATSNNVWGTIIVRGNGDPFGSGRYEGEIFT